MTKRSLAPQRGVVLDVPVLDDSPWVYECRVIRGRLAREARPGYFRRRTGYRLYR